MKRVLIIFLFCFACVRVHASFGGAYVGIAGGVAHQSVDFKTSSRARPAGALSIPPTPPEIDATAFLSAHDAEVGKWNSLGEIFVGWGIQWSSWLYIGGRLGGNFSSYDVRHRFSNAQDVITDDASGTATVTNEAKLTLGVAEFTADLKPGYLLTQQTLLFGLIGVAVNQEKMSGRVEQATFGGTGGFSTISALPLSQRRLKAALRVGCGLEEKLTQRLALNLQYVFTFYPRLRAEGVGLARSPSFGTIPTIFLTAAGLRDKVKETPRKQLASIGLVYFY